MRFQRSKKQLHFRETASSFKIIWATSTRPGKNRDALKVLDNLDKMATDEYVPSNGRAMIFAAVEHKHDAIRTLEKAYQERSSPVYLKIDPPSMKYAKASGSRCSWTRWAYRTNH